eukprot:CAMPEP_0196746700 /NCGR_PEP_ID=MMETSP1091-20130531/66772_1 /TAXON_ID=302021 /ORGANISM="Rhodomonas sp., Strain CCMP768" /LENGTH=118 /DNA_ID=CAMNT_0042093709 /DNA_START=53 /DNA_END=409 /DNA_ORIENTATION=-
MVLRAPDDSEGAATLQAAIRAVLARREQKVKALQAAARRAVWMRVMAGQVEVSSTQLGDDEFRRVEISPRRRQLPVVLLPDRQERHGVLCLLDACFLVDTAQRPTAAKLLEHPFVTNS